MRRSCARRFCGGFRCPGDNVPPSRRHTAAPPRRSWVAALLLLAGPFVKPTDLGCPFRKPGSPSVEKRMPSELVSREEELASLTAFLGEKGQGPAALVLEGEPGIGKSTL